MVSKFTKAGPTGSACLTVFFDGACPLCMREIAFYRKQREADRIAWIDVSQAADENVAKGLSRKEALRRFHVRRPDGTFASGGSAFVELWIALPSFAKIGRVCRRKPLLAVLEAAYRLYLVLRPLLQRKSRGDICQIRPGAARHLRKVDPEDRGGS